MFIHWFLNLFIIVKKIRFLLIQIFINSLISANIFKFFIIIKIINLCFININFYMYLYIFCNKIIIYYDIRFL